MAKPKNEDGVEVDSLKSAFADIEKILGDNIMLSASTVIEEDEEIVSTSPKLDIALNGGIPRGSFVVVTGAEKTGKSTLAIHIGKKTQQMDPTAHVFYHDVEGRLKRKNYNTPGLDLDRFHIIRSKKGKILSAEEYLASAEKLMKTVPGSVVILDSFGSLCPESELTSEMDKQQRGDINKLNKKFCRKACNIIPTNKNIFIGITHRYSDVSGYGNPDREGGGTGLKFGHDIKIFSKKRTIVYVGGSEDAKGDPIGQKVLWKIEESSLGVPGKETEGRITYGIGIDENHELIEIGIDVGLISKSGSWYETTFLEENFRAQGLENLKEKMLANLTTIEVLNGKIRELLGWK